MHQPRLYFLDWLRILAFGALVLYHVGMYYVSWGWHVKSPHASAALEPWMLLSSPWRMSLLFLVSGAATAHLLQRSGPTTGALAERARRLLLPLLFGMLVVVPPQSYFEVVQRHGYSGGWVDFLALYFSGYAGFCSAPGRCLMLPTWNHLWFLPYLMTYTALLWGVLRLWPRALDTLVTRLGPRLRGAALLWLPVAGLIALRLLLRDRYPITHALVGDWYAHATYGGMFVAGVLCARAVLWQRLDELRWPALLLAVLGWATIVAGAPDPARGAAAGLMQWCAIVAAIGFAHRHLNRDGAWRRTLTEAVLPIYVLHQTLIIVLAMALASLALEPSVEAPLIVLATFVLCGLGYLAARRSRVLRPLFGMPAARQRALRAPALVAQEQRP